MRLTLEQILTAVSGQALSRHQTEFSGVGSDTRVSLKDQLFIALAGESFDGHSFLEKAVEQGAAGLLVHSEEEGKKFSGLVTVILVPDTLKALQALGRSVRRRSKATVIGVTGSNGKTTTKEFTGALLAPFRQVHFSKGSFNNHWGVPFTLLQLEPRHEVAVIEMGMNHAGELTELVGIAEPDAVVCTMVGRAHVEHFGSIDKIAAAKAEIYAAAKPDAIRIFNLDDPWTRKMRDESLVRNASSRILTFSAVDPGADVHFEIARLTMRELEVQGTIRGQAGRVGVQVFGAQNLVNLMAAAAAGLAVGLGPGEIWAGLKECRTAWGRNQFVKLASGAEMIFDAYNANPDSMGALLDNMRLLEARGRKIGVFGQMLELGAQSPELHREIARKAAVSGFNEVYFVGADHEAFGRGLREMDFQGTMHMAPDYSDELGARLGGSLRQGDIVVVKGSRGTKLERFVSPCRPLDFGPK